MSEETPGYEHPFQRGRIVVRLWPKGSIFEGKRTTPNGASACRNPTLLSLEIADAELLEREWARTPESFEQEAARSIRATLREYEQAITQEDMSNAED